jgi:hypothetical protein
LCVKIIKIWLYQPKVPDTKNYSNAINYLSKYFLPVSYIL